MNVRSDLLYIKEASGINKMSKSIKDLADEFGVTKAYLKHKIEILGLQSSLQKIGNKLMIDLEQEKIIRDYFENNNVKTNHNDDKDLLYNMLKSELDKKDNQISALIKQNEQLTEALQNTTDSLKSAQALHAGTIQQQLNDSSVKEEKQIKKWWKFWC